MDKVFVESTFEAAVVVAEKHIGRAFRILGTDGAAFMARHYELLSSRNADLARSQLQILVKHAPIHVEHWDALKKVAPERKNAATPDEPARPGPASSFRSQYRPVGRRLATDPRELLAPLEPIPERVKGRKVFS